MRPPSSQNGGLVNVRSTSHTQRRRRRDQAQIDTPDHRDIAERHQPPSPPCKNCSKPVEELVQAVPAAQVLAPQQEYLPSVQVSAPRSSAQETVSELLKVTTKA